MLMFKGSFDMMKRAGRGVVIPFPALAKTVNWVGVEHAMTEHNDSIPLVKYKLLAGYLVYRVGDDGSFWSRTLCGGLRGRSPESVAWKQIKGCVLARGHVQIILPDRRDLLHRIVLETFVGPCPEGMECRHLDGDPSNNRLDNLCWGTRLENSWDMVRHGRSQKGEKHYKSKLTEDDVREIVRLAESGVFPSMIASTFNVCAENIRAILRGETWNHVTGLIRYTPKRRNKPRKIA